VVDIKPTLIMVVGVPGSGKTTLASALTKRIVNSAVISKDLIQTEFAADERLGQVYSKVARPTFNLLVSFSKTLLAHEKVPIIDAPFSLNAWRNDALSNWVKPFKEITRNTRLVIIRCLPKDEEHLKKRLLERGHKRDKWKLDNWGEFLKREPIRFPIDHDDVLEIVTDKPVEEIAERVLGYLQ